MSDDDATANDGLKNRDVARLRDSVKLVAAEDTFGNRFTLLGEAGSGGMGVVYEAKDRQDGRRVAIKVITGLPGPAERARFAAEVEVLERLDHPAIVDYVDHGVTRDGEPFLAMEWLVGESLSARLARGRLTADEAAVLGERIAGALEHAHAAGVVHRDVKPSNIFLVDDELEEAHLIDFGVAKRADHDLTHTGQLIGTPGYMAPEQVRGDKTISASADIFALGCVLYRSLTGREAFAGQDVMEVLARLLLEDPPPVDELVPETPVRLAHLIGSMLSKDATRRLGDAAVVRAELQAIRAAIAANDSTALELRPDAIPAQTPAGGPRPRLRPPAWLVAVAGGGLLLGIATLAIVVVSRGSGDQSGGAELTRCDAVVSVGCKARCDADDATACFFLARTLHERPPVDHEGGRVADARACRLGEDRGCFQGASSLVRLSKPYAADDPRRVEWLAEAERLFVTGCDRGDTECCRELGKQLSKGFGLFAPDPARAFALVEKACEANNVRACKVLPDMIGDLTNGATPELRAHAQQVRTAACARLADLGCDR